MHLDYNECFKTGFIKVLTKLNMRSNKASMSFMLITEWLTPFIHIELNAYTQIFFTTLNNI